MKHRKTKALATAVALMISSLSFGAPTGPIYVPQPSLAASKSLTAALKYLKRSVKGDSSIISVQWTTPTRFKPHYSDGIQWHFSDAPHEWSWFVTYTVPAKGSRTLTGQEEHVNIRVLRIRGNGTIENPVGGST